MRQTALVIPSGKLALEGVLTLPQDSPGPHPGLLLCHPHSLLGGSMGHPLLLAICRQADRKRIATLRFNFRGVGDSEGTFDHGKGEERDVKAGLDVLRQWPGVDRRRLALAGYSFGASVILTGLRSYKAASSLVLIAPSVSAVQRPAVRRDGRTRLFLVGQRDRLVQSVELQRAIDDLRPPVEFAEIAAADHSLSGSEEEIAERVVDFIEGSLRG